MVGDAEHADLLALLYSLLGGFFMGAYPVPIKAASVLKADPHPVIFQCYKTFWVFLTGWIFVLVRLIQQESLVFEFTWWGVVSAAGWIPSGLSTIAAVPRLGVGLAIAVSTGTASVLSFLVFWLVLGERMKEHLIGGQEVYLAPIYLICIIIGMVCLVAAPGLLKCTRSQVEAGGAAEAGNGQPAARLVQHPAASRAEQTKTFVYGLGFAVLAGVLSAVQFGAVNLGKRAAENADGCSGDSSKCSAVLREQFNNFGSWDASFGIGALLVTGVYVVGFFSLAKVQRKDLPEFHFKVLYLPGSLAGLLWVLGNFFQTAAVVRGGNAVMLPANQGIQLVTSGAFGLFYYWEVPDRRKRFLWILAALWTLAAIILLSKEKSS